MLDAPPARPYARPIPTVLLAWLLSLGIDFFLHAAVLARVYAVPQPFLLGPADATRRIPVGYLSFLLLTAALFWLCRRLAVRGALAGARTGLAAGVVVWGALVLGLYSIATASVGLLVGWWIGQAVELALAGAVIGAVSGGARLRRVTLFVVLAVIGFFVLTVIAQSTGIAPPMGATTSDHSPANVRPVFDV